MDTKLMSFYLENPFLAKSNDIVLVKDAEHKIVAFNETFSRLSGVVPKDLIGLSDHDMLWSNNADIYIDHERDIMAGENYSVIEPLQGTDNVILHTTKKPIFNHSGQRVGTMAKASFVKDDVIMHEHLGGKSNILKVMDFPNNNAHLTTMESKLVYLLMRGFTRKKAAEALNISVKAFDFHQENIKKKLSLSSSKDIIFYGLSKGWQHYLPFVIQTQP
ncbi:PAS domain-containing protein [Vibrio sp. S4M6]|uniref:PAS domain-containing protein n=1 Tax=Vibrio sinus TaxID=2946865 RepID=UPI00202A11AB|nr:PAS domain-containing protein [Vibrio sinus]MCL9781591.1 PAS domain-containing protein [Vibrio sinus]